MTKSYTFKKKARFLHRVQRDDPAGTEDLSGADVLCDDELMKTRWA